MTDFKSRRSTMVDTQIRPSDVTKFPIIDAMLSVPRERFVPEDMREAAYAENAINVAGRVMLEPRTFAKILDALDIGRSDLILDIGCGLGYSAAVLGHMAEAVVAVENDENRANEAQTRLMDVGIDNVAVVEGDLSEGMAKHGPYDVILVEGAVEMIPQAILDQLKDGGRIAAIFAQGAMGKAKIAQKSGDKLDWRVAFDAAAVTLPGFELAEEFEL